MKNITTIVGIGLIVVSVISFTYQGINYTTREDVVRLGELKITAETQERIPLPPILGGVALVAGLVLVYLGSRKK